jgi:negative regulator of sigma-B (phosphoserine phosphatase)
MFAYFNDDQMELAAIEQAKPGESCSGDAYTVIQKKDFTVCAVIDGLGSGEGALQSAKAAVGAIGWIKKTAG